MSTLSATTEVAADAAQGIISPIKFAHVVFRTSRFREMIDWYKLVLNAGVAFENEFISFITYDEEHHRVAFVSVDNLADPPEGIAGVQHLAYGYATLRDLLQNYARLAEKGIKPAWAINHGPTTSLYYVDPDGNQLEFQVDNFDTVEEAGAFFFSRSFAVNPIGVDIDPAELYERLLAGESEEKLKERPPSGPRNLEGIGIR